MEITIKGKGIVKGMAEGQALIFKNSFSFVGEVDIKSGEITAGYKRPGGANMAKKVLVFPAAKGSSGNWRNLLQLALHKKQPAAIIVKQLDATLVQGAILANVPLICYLEKDPLEIIETGDLVQVDAINGIVKVKKAQ